MNTIARNLIWLLGSQLATWGVSILLLITAPDRLGPDQFGQLQFTIIFVSFFTMFGALGCNTFIMKIVARDRPKTGAYVFNGLAMKGLSVILLSFLAVGLAYVLGYPSETVTLVAIACVGMVFLVLNDVVSAALFGLERAAGPAMFAVLQKYIGAAIGLYILYTSQNVFAYAASLACVGIISLTANLILLWPEIRHRMQIDFGMWKLLLVGGLPFFIWNALLVVYGTIDIPILQALAGNETVAWYSVAYLWVSLPVFFTTIVFTAFFPSLSNQAHSEPENFLKNSNRALRLTMFIGLPIAAGTALIVGDIISMVYEPSYGPAIIVAQILAIHIPVVAMDMVLSMALIARDKQKQWLIVGCVAAVVNPLLNIALIPASIAAFDNGAIGAAAVTVGTEVVMMIGAIYLRPKGVLDRRTTAFVLRAGAAALAMIPVVLVLGGAPLPVKIVVGAVTYAVASLALRTVTPHQIRIGFSHVSGTVRMRGQAVPAAAAD